jgi:hypothetical protein
MRLTLRHTKILPLLLLVGLAVESRALTPAELLTPELKREAVTLTGLRDGVLSYFGDDRRLTRERTDRFLRLTLLAGSANEPAENESSESAAMIELVDGQHLTGRLDGPAFEGDGLRWVHPELGAFEFRLDTLRAIRFNRESLSASQHSATAATPDQDRVTLSNGDTLSGFILAMTRDEMVLLIEETDTEVNLPLARIAEIVFANPPVNGAASSDRVRLVDGSTVHVEHLAIAQDEIVLIPSLSEATQNIAMDTAALDRVDFAGSRYRLIPLLDQPMLDATPADVFGLKIPAEIRGQTLHAHAPCVLTFALPEGVTRFGATARIDYPSDASARQRAAAEFSITINTGPGTESLGTFELSHEQPKLFINVKLDGQADQLTLELDDGAFGPILDRLRLEDAVLLIDSR